MKIRIYHERKDEAIVLEVPDEECEIMVENDYRRCLGLAEDKSSVQRRTAQEIMDEDFNKPTFNKNQAETRRHVLLSALDPEERYFAEGWMSFQKLSGKNATRSFAGRWKNWNLSRGSLSAVSFGRMKGRWILPMSRMFQSPRWRGA